MNQGHYESRKTGTFDKWKYLASNGDLIKAFGSDTYNATRHYVSHGYTEDVVKIVLMSGVILLAMKI